MYVVFCIDCTNACTYNYFVFVQAFTKSFYVHALMQSIHTCILLYIIIYIYIYIKAVEIND